MKKKEQTNCYQCQFEFTKEITKELHTKEMCLTIQRDSWKEAWLQMREQVGNAYWIIPPVTYLKAKGPAVYNPFVKSTDHWYSKELFTVKTYRLGFKVQNWRLGISNITSFTVHAAHEEEARKIASNYDSEDRWEDWLNPEVTYCEQHFAPVVHVFRDFRY
jgi:hypothetical protein